MINEKLKNQLNDQNLLFAFQDLWAESIIDKTTDLIIETLSGTQPRSLTNLEYRIAQEIIKLSNSIDSSESINLIHWDFIQKAKTIENFLQSSENKYTQEHLEQIKIQVTKIMDQIISKYTIKIEKIINSQKNQKIWKEEKKEVINILDEIIKEMLEKMKELLQMDLVGVYFWNNPDNFLLEDKNIFLYKCNDSHFLKEKIVRNQIKEALHNIKVSWNPSWIEQYIYECPSDSSEGWVDVIIGLKNILPEINWFLLLDDYNDRRELSKFEIFSMCKIFNEKLKSILAEKRNILWEHQVIKLKEEKDLDHLTWLPNRKKAYQIFRKIAQRINRDQRWSYECYQCWISFFDIDDFKYINDEYGHDSWDETLKKFSEILKNWRENDKPIRRGGEEFLMINEQTDFYGTLTLAERKREEMKNTDFYTINEYPIKFNRTSSIGITQIYKKEIKLMESINMSLNKQIQQEKLCKYNDENLEILLENILLILQKKWWYIPRYK